jgi:NifB/MoaA-like Fe-S oxidoreductase
MLKHDEAKFLDDVTIDELAEKLQIPLIPVSGIHDFLEKLGENGSKRSEDRKIAIDF